MTVGRWGDGAMGPRREGAMQRCGAEEVGLKKARDHLTFMARSTSVRGLEAY